MTEDQRDILERVASGELSPAEAEALLNAPRTKDRPASGVRRVRVEAGFGAIAVVGDPSVAEAEVDGAHTAHIEDETLVITADEVPGHPDGDAPGVFAINLGRRRGTSRFRNIRIDRSNIGVVRTGSGLRIRLNPDLELDAKLDAGPMSITGINAPIRARSAAGPITIDGICAPVDVSVNAGAIRIAGLFAEGESRVRSDAGAIRIELDPASSVRVVASALVGKVVLPLAGVSKGFGSSHEVVVGDGTAVLRVETAMGSINVSHPGSDA